MKAFYQRFLLFSRAKQIALSVIFLHLAILFALLSHHLVTLEWRSPKPMLIRTVVAAKPAPVLTTTPSGSKKTAAPISTPTPSSPKKSKTTTSNKTTKNTAPAAATTTTWKEIAESLNSITAEPKKALPALNVPTKAASHTPLPEETAYAEDPSYGEYLITFLQNTLELPEYGEVKIKIEIDSFGQLVDCQILESKNPKNASFLKESLPSLHFPIPQLGPFESTKMLDITFKNK